MYCFLRLNLKTMTLSPRPLAWMVAVTLAPETSEPARMPPLSPMAGRLKRAQDNLFETLPLFAIAVLIAHVADRNGVLTHWETAIFLAARVLYVPLYAFGVKQIRSLAWLVSIVGLGMVAAAILV